MEIDRPEPAGKMKSRDSNQISVISSLISNRGTIIFR